MVRMTVRVMIRVLVKIGIIVNPKWHPAKGSKELIQSFTKKAITCTIIYIKNIRDYIPQQAHLHFIYK